MILKMPNKGFFLSSFERCPRLQELNLPYCSSLLDPAAFRHLQSCAQLRSVNLAYCRDLSDAAVEALSLCLQLETVNF